MESSRTPEQAARADIDALLSAGAVLSVGLVGRPRLLRCALWVLAPANDSHALPTVNGVPIPLTNPNQHTRLSASWLRNEHRAGVQVKSAISDSN